MREMSDNDILCDSGKMDVVKTVMEGLGYSCEVFEEFHHDVYSKPPTLEFEMHHTLFTDDSLPEFSEYFSSAVICARIFSVIASPEASSPARFI